MWYSSTKGGGKDESQETPLRMAEQLESICSSGRGRARGGYIGALSQFHCRISFGHLSTSVCAHHSEEDTVVGNTFGDQSNFSRPSVTPEPSPPINSCVMRPCPLRTFTLGPGAPQSDPPPSSSSCLPVHSLKLLLCSSLTMTILNIPLQGLS